MFERQRILLVDSRKRDRMIYTRGSCWSESSQTQESCAERLMFDSSGIGATLMPPPSTAPSRGRLVNTMVVVVKGTSKGLMGVIKDVVGEMARVELKTNNKTLTIALSSLKRKE